MQYQLRTYSFKSEAAAAAYKMIWVAHIESLKLFDIATLGVFTVPTDPLKVVALVSYADGVDIAEMTVRYMSSDAFKSDMAGFDGSQFAGVSEILLTPTAFSALQ